MSQAEQVCSPDERGRCVTCADEALPATVLRVEPELGLAIVALEGDEVEIDISLVDEVAAGDLLLVHGGVAIAHSGRADE